MQFPGYWSTGSERLIARRTLRFLWQLKLPHRCPNFADMFIKGVLMRGSKFACVPLGVKVDGFNGRMGVYICPYVRSTAGGLWLLAIILKPLVGVTCVLFCKRRWRDRRTPAVINIWKRGRAHAARKFTNGFSMTGSFRRKWRVN